MRFVLTLFAAGIALSSCSCGPPPVPAGGALCGSGNVDGVAHAVDAANSRFLILVKKVDNGGCGFAHNHVVKAETALLQYEVDSANLASGSITLTVPAAGLVADEDALRQEFFPGEPLLSEGDRNSIRGSALDEVDAQNNPTMTFTVTGLSAVSGEGTATLTANIAGQESEVPLTYTIAKTGDAYDVSGTAVIDGAPHNIPHGPLGFCVVKDMEVHFTLKLAPGSAECEGLPDPPPPFEETFFDDQECAETVGFNQVRDVVGARCMGCHQDPPRGGATVPLTTWEDFRVDSFRRQGEPLYLTAHEYINVAPEEGLAMPTIDATPLNPGNTAVQCTWCVEDELALLNEWIVDNSGRNAKCADDPGPTTFPRVQKRACADPADVNQVHFRQPDADGNTAELFFQNNCSYCHSEGNELASPVAPKVATFNAETGLDDVNVAAGDEAGQHPFYADDTGAPLSFWEMSVFRVLDSSMYPFGGVAADDPSFLIFQQWVASGYPEDVCE
jgi:hypothetical protein